MKLRVLKHTKSSGDCIYYIQRKYLGFIWFEPNIAPRFNTPDEAENWARKYKQYKQQSNKEVIVEI